MPKRYISLELVKLGQEFGWRLAGVRVDHHNFKQPASRFIVTIVHPQKDVAGGVIGGHSEENQTGGSVLSTLAPQVMRFLIMLEQTETGVAVQLPDLAITTYCAFN